MVGGLSGMEGMAWYPTNTRMPDGKVLVAGGFARCCDTNFSNRTLQTFDPVAQDQMQNPWALVAPHSAAPSEMNPGLRDYIHSFLLPSSVNVNGLPRNMAFMGANGRIVLANTDASTPTNQRFALAPNGQRSFGSGGWDSTAALVSTGEIMTMGGTDDGSTAQRIDLYNPMTATSRTIDTGIGRRNGSSVLLPDGTVLLINGGTDERNFAGDRRRPQVVNIETGSVNTLEAWPNDTLERGYHNFAILLKDGRVLIGGGISPIGGIGCERPDLRVYSPPYLTNGTRPVVANPPVSLTMRAGGATTNLNFSGATLKSSEQGGVVLMALGSTTHSFDQNQRYVKLPYIQTGSTLSITPPANTQIAPPGDYVLFLVSQTGAPSVGITVRIEKSSAGSSSSSSSIASSSSVPSATFHLRGTHNAWAEGDLFTRVAGSTTNLEICRNFTAGDGGGGPRFKVDPNGGWGDAFPATDIAAAGWTKVVVNGSNRSVLSTTTNMAANCGTTASSSSSVPGSSSSASSRPSSASSAVSSSVASSVISSSIASSSSAPMTPFHLRGTQNGWAEGDLFTTVPGSSTQLEICRNFISGDASGGPRFKVDPNGGWGDAFPATDIPASGWTKVIINGSTRTVTSTTTNLTTNCGAAASSSSGMSSSSSVASSTSSSASNVQIIMKPSVQTTTGQNVFIVGDKPQLSNWNTAAGVPCTTSAATAPVWTCQGFTLTPGTTFSYKYIKRDNAGNVVWEGGANRTRTAPSVTTTYNETWQ